MQANQLPAYTKMEQAFVHKGYTIGTKDDLPIYSWNNTNRAKTPGHYVDAINYGKIKFKDVPEEYRTREFFLHALSGIRKDIIEYIKVRPERFDKQFFKDHIATNYHGLEFELNDFEWMPLEFIDDELVMCAMFRSINMRYADRRGDCDAWFYSVHRRKPEVLTEELYVLGARCFASKVHGTNHFLEITPEKYRTREYYFALCLQNDTPVMEDIPESVLDDSFLVSLLNENLENIKSFSESALERELSTTGGEKAKAWQVAVILDGYRIRDIPLNDERIQFFLSKYDKDSSEYEYGFKEHYKNYLRQKNKTPTPKDTATEFAGMVAMASLMGGADPNFAIDFAGDMMKATTKRQSMLPIHYCQRVPEQYSKKFDREEYLLEIYKKIGIEILGEANYYYYNVLLPDEVTVEEDDYDSYVLKTNEGEALLRYYDRGPFYDRSVKVDIIYITL